MAAPNIVNVTQISGSTAVQAVTTTPTAIVENTSSSNQVFKVNALYCSNIDGAANVTLTVELFRNSTAYYIVKDMIVPTASTMDILSKPIYLEEGDALRLTSGDSSDISAVCSYEVIS